MRPTLLAALVAAVSCSPSLGEEPDMVCLRSFGVAVVEGVEETTLTSEYLPREMAEARIAARPESATMQDLSVAHPTNQEEKAACEAGL